MTAVAGSRGPLPFSSTDSSILLKSTLDSASAVTSPLIGSAGSISSSGITFQSGRGFSRAASGNCGVTWSSLTGFAALDACGQMSFEIERAAICTLGSVYGSVADATNFGWIAVWTNDGGTTYGNLRTGSSDPSTNILSFKNAGETNGAFQMHSHTKGDFVRVTITWNGAKCAMLVDGVPTLLGTAATRSVAWANQFTTLWLMHFNQGNGIRSRFMRNLLISTKPAVVPVNPSRRVAFYGHSFAASYVASNSNACYDATIDQLINRRFAKYGYQVECTANGVGGGYVISALTSASFQLRNSTYLNALAARKATDIVVIAGTNDVGNASFTAADFDTDFKAMLTSIAAGHDEKFEQNILVMTVPSRSGDIGTWSTSVQANVLAANEKIAALPTWWDTTFASRAGQLKVLDLFTAWGGIEPPRNADAVMAGLIPGATNNLHPTGNGTSLIADLVHAELLRS